MKAHKSILAIIVISQFFCTSLWFVGNGIIDDLVVNFGLHETAIAHLTSAVQFGFICGTLVFAILTIADRFSPSKVFLFSAILASLFNATMIIESNQLVSLLSFRFLTGFFLAGIYPVGMKIAADHFKEGLGKSLSFLVGALVLGTALPHLLKGYFDSTSWKYLILTTSFLAITGGVLMRFFVPDGPFRKSGKSMDLKACLNVFKNQDFRNSAFGYFGHMWELYAFWAFVPLLLKRYVIYHRIPLDISLLSFFIIAIGAVACIIGGFSAYRFGTKKIAFLSLLFSMVCCLAFPFVFTVQSLSLIIVFFLFWGMVVISDSPLFSTLVAQNTDAETKGTALTIVNCIGFAITIVSIQLIHFTMNYTESNYVFCILAIGPLLGLLALSRVHST